LYNDKILDKDSNWPQWVARIRNKISFTLLHIGERQPLYRQAPIEEILKLQLHITPLSFIVYPKIYAKYMKQDIGGKFPYL
jgi:GTPase SAR1 family protein